MKKEIKMKIGNIREIMKDGLDEDVIYSVDPKTGHLFHFAQRDLINCDCSACKLKDMPYHIKTMAHNLLFYKEFTETIRVSIEDDKTDHLLNKYLDSRNSEKVKKIVEFK